jgi:hypothetical protein
MRLLLSPSPDISLRSSHVKIKRRGQFCRWWQRPESSPLRQTPGMWPKLPSPHSPFVIEIRPLTSHSTASQLPSSQLFEFPIRPSCGVNTTPISPSCCFHPHGSTMAPPNQTRRKKDDDAFPTQQLTVLGQSPSISAARSLTIAGASIEAEC